MFEQQRKRWNYKGLFNDGSRQWAIVVTLLFEVVMGFVEDPYNYLNWDVSYINVTSLDIHQ